MPYSEHTGEDMHEHLDDAEQPAHTASDAVIDEKPTTINSTPYTVNEHGQLDWDGPNDPGNPQNYTRWKKWSITVSMALVTFCCTFASAVFSSGTVQAANEFSTSNLVMTLGTALFVAGYVIGPLVWGPLSEIHGRKAPFFVGFIVFAILQIPVAIATNIETILVCRFISGCFGCGPLVICGGALVDMWDPVMRGVSTCVFAGATFLGPTTAPVIGGFIVDSYLGWRWTAWITFIMSGLLGTFAFFVVPETHSPTILKYRARKIRLETKLWSIHARAEEESVDLKHIMTKVLVRPMVMLVYEPILMLMTLYMSVIYGIIYLFFEAFPISFQQERGWNNGVGSLPFISLAIGVLFALIGTAWLAKTRYNRLMQENGRLEPEERLLPMMLGGLLLPIGLFWFAWTSNPSINPWPQTVAAAPIGAGIMLIFNQGLNYIMDCYLSLANSAIAANTFIRSAAAAGFPMFAAAMFNNLGVPWATSILAFVTVALAPIPFCFYTWGSKVRQWSRYSHA